MKKYILAIPLFALLFAACDPIEEEEGSVSNVNSSEQLEQITTLTQIVENQNKFIYSTTPATQVQILDADGNILNTGARGQFDLNPGGDTQQTFTVRSVNQDGSIASYNKKFVVSEYVDVDTVWALLCGDDYGSKSWTWDDNYNTDHRIWGNSGRDTELSSLGLWWGRTLDDIEVETGYVGYDKTSYMTFTTSGTKIQTYKSDGSLVEEGTFSFKTGGESYCNAPYALGYFEFKGASILQGISQNDEKKKQYKFDILKITADQMVLRINTESNSYEGWYWFFKAVEED